MFSKHIFNFKHCLGYPSFIKSFRIDKTKMPMDSKQRLKRMSSNLQGCKIINSPWRNLQPKDLKTARYQLIYFKNNPVPEKVHSVVKPLSLKER